MTDTGAQDGPAQNVPAQDDAAQTGGAQRFADALQEFERSGDVEAFVGGVFAGDAELHRPEHRDQTESGRQGAATFWEQYRSQFDGIASSFSRVEERGGLGVLEWTSEGSLSTGRPIRYAGVSVLDLDGEGRVTRFATWYDTAAFIAPQD